MREWALAQGEYRASRCVAVLVEGEVHLFLGPGEEEERQHGLARDLQVAAEAEEEELVLCVDLYRSLGRQAVVVAMQAAGSPSAVRPLGSRR